MGGGDTTACSSSPSTRTRGTEENRIATIIAGAGVQAGISDQRIDHYDVLRTLEDMYGLPPLGQAADAHAITGIWTTG